MQMMSLPGSSCLMRGGRSRTEFDLLERSPRCSRELSSTFLYKNLDGAAIPMRLKLLHSSQSRSAACSDGKRRLAYVSDVTVGILQGSCKNLRNLVNILTHKICDWKLRAFFFLVATLCNLLLFIFFTDMPRIRTPSLGTGALLLANSFPGRISYTVDYYVAET